MLKGCNDAKPFVSKNSGRLLEQFVKEDFDELAKEELKKMVGQSTDNRGQFAKLAAWVGINDIEPILISFLNEKMSSKDKLDIRLALARLGHSESINYIVGKIKTLAVNDDVMIEIVPMLVFTRQKEAFDYLISIINSEEKNCTSAHPDSNEPMVCGYRVLEFIAPVIANFPVKTDASGELIGDYNKNLTTARSWFKANSYTILTDTF